MALSDFHGALDLRIFEVLNRDGGPLMDTFMRVLSTRTFGIGFGFLLAALLVARLGRGAARPLIALALAILVSDLVGSQLLRPALGRMRPCYALPPGTFRLLGAAANGPSLPSLHASNMFALAWVVWWARPRLAWLAFAMAIAISVSRVYLGVHWPSDVVAGALWGTFAAAIGWAFAGRFAPAEITRRPG